MQSAGTLGQGWVSIKEYIGSRRDKPNEATVRRWCRQGYDGAGQRLIARKEGKLWYIWVGNRPVTILDEYLATVRHPGLRADVRVYDAATGSYVPAVLDIAPTKGPGTPSVTRLVLLTGSGSFSRAGSWSPRGPGGRPG